MCREDSSGPCKGTCNERSVCRITLGRVDVQIVLETEERPVPADQSAEIVPVAWLPMCGRNIHLTRKGCRNTSECVEKTLRSDAKAMLQEMFD